MKKKFDLDFLSEYTLDNYFTVLKYVFDHSCDTVVLSKSELIQCILEVLDFEKFDSELPSKARVDFAEKFILNLDPFLVHESGEQFSFNKDVLEKYFRDFYPDKIFVDQNDYENSDHDTYKYLFEKVSSDFEMTLKDLDYVKNQFAMSSAAHGELENKVNYLENVVASLTDEAAENFEKIKSLLIQDVDMSSLRVVSCLNSDDGAENTIIDCPSVSAVTDTNYLSDKPAVYNFKRPSWFVIDNCEDRKLNNYNYMKKLNRNTQSVFTNLISKVKEMRASDDPKGAADQYDSDRQKSILDLLNSDFGNEEKYLRYIFLTPGMPRDFHKTLLGASDIGIDANVLISFLEQGYDSFDKDLVETYVSQLHKGNEYKYKFDLARELVAGEWYIEILSDGQFVKYQLVPVEKLDELISLLDKIKSVLSERSLDSDSKEVINNNIDDADDGSESNGGHADGKLKTTVPSETKMSSCSNDNKDVEEANNADQDVAYDSLRSSQGSSAEKMETNMEHSSDSVGISSKYKSVMSSLIN